eukprot:TRINITY_DN18593_c0_g1_i1.p1 TRINITY_DN18593_c0_g1~~TRINITY_DN18593_c0_g1_i1.p1  ORF type:complete len:372 (+),score=180.58 TRINITY_DN18593_c0_g1_i1:62-1117(+)
MARARQAVSAASRSLKHQRRFYYPSNQPPLEFNFDTEKEKWTDPTAKVMSLSELYNGINPALSECEDILSTWRETKYFNRGIDAQLKQRMTEFLKNKYDLGLEPNFLDRLLLQYALMRSGTFDRAFSGYIRSKSGNLVFDTEPRFDTVRKMLYTNVPVIDDLYHLTGMAGTGYRNNLGRMLGTSLEHAIPTGKASIYDYSKVIFQHRHTKEDGSTAVRVLGSHSDNEEQDFVMLHPHAEERGKHHLTLIVIGSENKYKRRVQVPDAERRHSMARRAEKVFSLPEGSVATSILLLPPWMLDRSSLLQCHAAVGGLAPIYADWLPYYHHEVPASEVDWAHQVQKEREDEYYQL